VTDTVRPGSLVTVWEGGELMLGVVAGEEKRRVRLILEGGREIRVQPARIGWEVEDGGPVPGTTVEARRQAGRRVEHIERDVAGRTQSIDVPVLWEIAYEEAANSARGRTDFDTEELADLALDDRSGAAMAALVRALRADGLHFTRKGERWEPRRPEQVAELRLERERVKTRESETSSFFEALRGAVRDGQLRASGGEFEARYLEALRQLAIHDEDTPEAARDLALAALEASGLRHDRPHEGAFRLCRLAGVFAHADVNLQVLRYDLRIEFPPAVLEHAAAAARRGWSKEGREDLTGLETLTIDGPSTREVDDALSAEPIEGGLRIGVHIADPGAWVEPGDPVDGEAQARGLTHYHPDLRLPMFPSVLSEESASLLEGVERPALSFIVDLDDAGGVRASRVVRSVIQVKARMDYDAADRAAESSGTWAGLVARLVRFGDLREQARLARGAISIRIPEIDLHVGPDGRVELERIDPASPSRRAVSEAMVLAGEVGAALCVASGIPAIFRRQAAAELPQGIEGGVVSEPIAARRVRRVLTRAESSVRPGPHHGLGLPAYVQVTSPLRRFQDLATQRQIGAHLAGRPAPYDGSAMQRIAATTEQVELEARRAERAAEDYWMLRYLEGSVGETIEALVVESDPRPIVLLLETLREQPLPSLAGVEAGTPVRLVVQRVNPRAGLLVLRLADG